MTILSVSSKATKGTEAKFHIQSPGVEEMKICLNRPGHMLNVIITIYGKSLYNSSFPEPMALKLGMAFWVLEFYHDYSTDVLGLTSLTAMPNMDKNFAECYVAPALCLHIRNSMKASL